MDKVGSCGGQKMTACGRVRRKTTESGALRGGEKLRPSSLDVSVKEAQEIERGRCGVPE